MPYTRKNTHLSEGKYLPIVGQPLLFLAFKQKHSVLLSSMRNSNTIFFLNNKKQNSLLFKQNKLHKLYISTMDISTKGKSFMRKSFFFVLSLTKGFFFSHLWQKENLLVDIRLASSHHEDVPGIDSSTQRNLFQILLNQTEIRLYLPFSSIDLE